MSRLRVEYDAQQHCTCTAQATGKSVATDACRATGGKGEEISPGELVGSGLAGCMLFSMGIVALRDGLDLTGTQVTLDVAAGEDRIHSIELEFVLPRDFTPAERKKLEKAASLCPIKRSFLPEISVSTHYSYPERAAAS